MKCKVESGKCKIKKWKVKWKVENGKKPMTSIVMSFVQYCSPYPLLDCTTLRGRR